MNCSRLFVIALLTFLWGNTWSTVAFAQDSAPPAPAPNTGELVFFVPSSGWVADRTFITLSKSAGYSALSRKLAEGLAAADSTPVRVIVAGKSEAKTLQVISDAFRSIATKQLRLLDFTFVGTAKASEQIASLVAAVGGVYHTRTTLGYDLPEKSR
ncbi:MAG: hypothetical protein JSR66_32100 [Proteobacteria bacterium]|nr:hypothetical protein [Pseudomonadota bacterium]